VTAAVGHMVPQTRALEALDMFSRFITAQSLLRAGGLQKPTYVSQLGLE